MCAILRTQQKVHTDKTNRTVEVESFIGGGLQGEVYRAKMGAETVALKWYLPQYLQQDPQQLNRLLQAIAKGAPNSRFLWPQDIVKEPNTTGFGYIMPLREARFKGIMDLMKGRADSKFSSLATAGFELADCFAALHFEGLCYRDINFGNVFFDPDTGEIRVCDNDNVDVNNTPGIVAGSPDFMAPEVIRGDNPNIKTDAFSLAILLFYMLFRNHPLQGEKILHIHIWNEAARKQLFGINPVFIFDPNDKSNHAVPVSKDSLKEAGANALNYWNVYPEFLRQLFTRAFTTGIAPEQRVLEPAWRAAMVQLRDSIVCCPKCGKQNFYDIHTYPSTAGVGRCWNDNVQLALPPRLRIGSEVIAINKDTKLYPHHTEQSKKFIFSHPTAEVSENPNQKGQFGLKNLSKEKWVAKVDNTLRDIEPGKSVALKNGVSIQFGTVNGEIRL